MKLPPKTKAKHGHEAMIHLLLDSKQPVDARAQMLISAFQTGDPMSVQSLAAALLASMSAAAPSAEVEKLKATFSHALSEMEQGGVRPALFIGVADCELPGPKPRAHVVTPDGQQRFPFFHPSVNHGDLWRGQVVILDSKGSVVLGTSNVVPETGPHATFVRRLPGSDHVEVQIHEEKVTFYAARRVLEAEEAGQLKRGDEVLICPHQQFAFDVVPADQNRRHRFVDRSKLPNVLPHRDIGNPHPCLGWLVYRTRILMFREDLRKKFDLRPRVSLLMTGPSGTGKTLTIKAFLTLFHEMLVERTGIEDLGSRVIRVKLSEQLSEWLGRTDKNFDSLFDDIQQLAAEEIETGGGEKIRLPVVVILEEVEGLARRRSLGNHDGSGGAMDRIMGTLLQRLDDPLDELSELKLVIISTSNRESLIDTAMHRRLGAKVARFQRLDRRGLAAVLSKKVKAHYPLAAANGQAKEGPRQQLIDEVVANLFGPENDAEANLEITLADGTKLTRFPRDFLTGAVVEQALSEAIDELTFHADQTGRDDVGLDSTSLISALRSQIGVLADNVTAYNAADYLDVPEHTHVANVRRQPGSNGQLNNLLATPGDDG